MFITLKAAEGGEIWLKIKMYKRPNGTFGVRNRIAVIPTVACVNHIVQSIASSVDIADAYTHP